eukprot:3594189-Prymnesium_polylepis.1
MVSTRLHLQQCPPMLCTRRGRYADNLLYSYAKPASIVAMTLFGAVMTRTIPVCPAVAIRTRRCSCQARSGPPARECSLGGPTRETSRPRTGRHQACLPASRWWCSVCSSTRRSPRRSNNERGTGALVGNRRLLSASWVARGALRGVAQGARARPSRVHFLYRGQGSTVGWSAFGGCSEVPRDGRARGGNCGRAGGVLVVIPGS